MAAPDVLAIVIGGLAERMPDTWIADVLPPDDELADELPCVTVDELPGNERRPWGGGPGLLIATLDIDVYAASRLQTRGVRDQITDAIGQIWRDAANPITHVKVDSGWHTRPDFNRRIRRVGAEFTVTARDA